MLSVNKVTGVLLLVVAVASVAALAWIGSSLHYGSCVAAAEARTPIGPPSMIQDAYGEFQGQASPSTRARRAAVEGCSRLP